MRLKKILGLLAIITFLSFALFGCGSESHDDDDTKNAGIRVVFVDIDSGEEIRESIIMKGKLGEFWNIEIPEIQGYLAVLKGPITAPYQDPMLECYLPYIRIVPLGPNQGRVIIKYIDQQGQFVNFEEIIGTIGESRSFTHDFPTGDLQVVNPNQETLTFSFSGELQIFEVTVAPIVFVEKFDYTVNYLEENTNKVLHTQLTGRLPKGETLDLVSHPVIPGYTTTTEQTKIVIKTYRDENVLNVYYVKDETQWATLTFSIGENATKVGQTLETYEVIKNHPLNGKHQPSINVPDFEAKLGYKIDPNGKWSEEFDPEGIITDNKTIYAQVIVDENQKFKYTVSYVENRPHGSEIHDKITGTHHLGTIELPEHPKIPGYTLETTERTFEIKDHEYHNRITIFYVKDPEQWVKIEFKPNHCSLEGTGYTEFEVIKDWPLYEKNQPNIQLQNITQIRTGYKKASDWDDWIPSFNRYGTVSEDTIYYANVVVDESQTFPYEILYHEQGPGYKKVHTTLSGFHHIGVLDLGNPPEIYGYNLVGEAPTTLEIWPNTYNHIIYRYEKDPDLWVTMRFLSRDKVNLTGTTPTTYYVLKDWPLNGANQPKITEPGIDVVGNDYILQTPNWIPTFSKSGTISQDTDFVVNVVLNPAVWTTITFKAGPLSTVEETTYVVRKNVPFSRSDQPQIILPTIVADLGYEPHPMGNWSPNYYVSDSVSEHRDYIAQVAVDLNQKFGYTVNYLEKSTNKVLHEVKTGETYIQSEFYIGNQFGFHPDIEGFILEPDQPLKMSITSVPSANVLNIYYTKDPSKWVTLTFIAGENATIEQSEFEVMKNKYLADPNQPEGVPPEIVPNPGYKVNPTGAWSPAFSEPILEAKTYYAQVIVDSEQWRDITIKHMGEDLLGVSTILLDTVVVNKAITTSIILADVQKTFTGYTFDPTNLVSYVVTNETTQEITIKYIRNKHTITFDTNGGSTTPSPMENVYYGAEILDVIALVDSPTKESHTFKGWTIGDTGVLLVAGDKMPDANLVLKAKWEVNP